jgi:hypothetical protein
MACDGDKCASSDPREAEIVHLNCNDFVHKGARKAAGGPVQCPPDEENWQ